MKPISYIAPETAAAEDVITVASPVSGKAVALAEVPDETFAQEILGKGCAVEPDENKIVAPDNAVVETLFDTHHAIGLRLDNGCELLIHIGINTVELEGEGFTALVSEGDKVTKGQTLITFDKELIVSKGYRIVTPVIVTNSDDYASVVSVAHAAVNSGETLLNIQS